MSHLINLQSPFLSLLISAEKAQRKFLYKTISEEQFQSLAEVLWNILNIPHKVESDAKFVHGKRKLLKELSAVKSYRADKKLYNQYYRQIEKILQHFRKSLMVVLR